MPVPAMLVLLGGLPGVGKSLLAEHLAPRLGAVVVSVDPIEDAILRAGIPQSFETGLAAYEVGATIATAQLRTGLTVIADAANYLEVGRAVWRDAAAAASAPVRSIHLVCSDATAHRSRLESRRRGLERYPEPTWEEVERRNDETEPWPVDALVLDTVQPIEVLAERALAHLSR